jgi:cyclic pyranopterin phosphate synthase
MQNTKFSHLKDNGEVNMVAISNKVPTQRTATAQAIVTLPAPVMEALVGGQFITPKGAVLQTAIIAGIMAAKKTGDLIPLCHPIGLEHCDIQISVHQNSLHILCTAAIFAKTGIEMEALVGASMAALTIYDMCKAMSHEIVISEIALVSKTGGKNDFSKNG